MNYKIVVVMLTVILVFKVQAQKDDKATIQKMCKSGKAKEFVDTCFKNNLKNPSTEKLICSWIDKKYVRFDQVLKDLCNVNSSTSKKVVAHLFKLVTTQYSKIKSMCIYDPKTCFMEYFIGE